MVKTIEWTEEGVRMIDQRKLPTVEEYPIFKTYRDIAGAIRSMVIRGAPAIGVAAAMGVALGVRDSKATNMAELRAEFDEIAETLAGTRPTAVNLFWAIERMKQVYAGVRSEGLGRIRERLVAEALAVRSEDIAINEAIGRNGADQAPPMGSVAP